MPWLVWYGINDWSLWSKRVKGRLLCCSPQKRVEFLKKYPECFYWLKKFPFILGWLRTKRAWRLFLRRVEYAKLAPYD